MKIAVFGAGYVGSVTAAMLAEDGHDVWLLDASSSKLDTVAGGASPVAEPGLPDVIARVVAQGRLRVSHGVEEVVQATDLAMICVGTPSADHGGIDLTYVERVCEEIGAALTSREPGYVVTVRSTVQPGTIESLVEPTLARASARRAGTHFHVAFNPEFLREGSAIADYRSPPKIVVGSSSPVAIDMMRRLYATVDASLVVVPTGVAELVKYADNAWHALKITFANELGRICRSAGVDSHAVIDVFLLDQQLNVSSAYLRPGFAFGGSCLPKDLRAILHYARHRDLRLPVMEQILRSNELLIDEVVQRIVAKGVRQVGLYGLSFKPYTDDLRESPFVLVVERLLGKGIGVRIYDENVQVAKLTGSYRAYVMQHLPHFVDLLVNSFDALEQYANLVIVGHATSEADRWIAARPDTIQVLDLGHALRSAPRRNYEGISW